ncbi:MAG: hypothetical protein ACD_77C00058G0008 [uncultured bacterium]|nr:MAG: hypothetical protein ACD_77C00058G0008 [uncultured bacterium]HBY01688.1 dTDP-4-dehydrorhamnose reductase [Rikenellaceae bacterium]
MANILITGSNGQLGNELKDLWVSGVLEALVHKGEHYLYFTDVAELDITNREAVEKFIAEKEIGIIVNCAAYTAVDKAEDDINSATAVNVDAAKNLAEALAKLNNNSDAGRTSPLLIHISTDYVFDGKGYKPYREDDACNPAGVYGRTKLEGEKAVEKSGCNYLIIRTSWLYSSYGANFVKTIARLAGEKESLNVVFDQVGTPTYAGDLAKAIDAVVKKYLTVLPSVQKSICGVYHFSNEGVCSWYDFAREIVKETGSSCIVKPVTSDQFPTKALRPHYSVLDKSKIKSVFGIEIPHWREAIAKEEFWRKLGK